jgi:hypothetical protein
MSKSTLEIAKPRIVPFFNACARRVWTFPQLETVLANMREEWQLAERIRQDEFIEFLLDNTPFVRTVLIFPSVPITRYWWGAPNAYELAVSINPTGYFSHHTAAFLHGLIMDEPTPIYINIEQRANEARQGSLQQPNIDKAFKRPARISHSTATFGDRAICQLHGKSTGQLGVIGRNHPIYGQMRLTNVARTLIDMVVRPAYSGGVSTVLSAFRKAVEIVTADELKKVLEDLQHVYPYHQSIGFLMEKTGVWDNGSIEVFQKMGMIYDFYLDYQMDNPRYSSNWRLYYPTCLDDMQA